MQQDINNFQKEYDKAIAAMLKFERNLTPDDLKPGDVKVVSNKLPGGSVMQHVYVHGKYLTSCLLEVVGDTGVCKFSFGKMDINVNTDNV